MLEQSLQEQPSEAHAELGTELLDPSRPNFDLGRNRAQEISARVQSLSVADDRFPTSKARPFEPLLFVPDEMERFPERALGDSLLEPIDKMIWLNIRGCVDANGEGRFPTQTALAKFTNVGSENTVWRAIAILRAARWLTLAYDGQIHRSRRSRPVYVLHHQPLPLIDTLFLDPDYKDFIQRVMAHPHARVRKIARDIQAAPEFEQAMPFNRDRAYGRFEMPAKLMKDRTSLALELKDDPQNSPPENSEPRASLRCCRCGCSCKALTTTTTTPTATENPAPPAEIAIRPNDDSPPNLVEPPSSAVSTPAPIPDYRWPDWLSTAARHQAVIELEPVPQPLRQTLIDQLDRRRRDGMQSLLDVLKHPIHYLRKLCQLALSGRIKATEPAASMTDSRPCQESSLSPADDRPTGQTPEQTATLMQTLNTAECDQRHWQRLSDGTNDLRKKALWQAYADHALAAIAQCRTALNPPRPALATVNAIVIVEEQAHE